MAIRHLPTVTGSFLALSSPLLVAFLGKKLIPVPGVLSAHLLCLLSLVACCSAVLLILTYWEKEPLSSIGIKRPTLLTAASGAALACFFVFVFSPAAYKALEALGLSGFESGMSKFTVFPVWYRIGIILLVGPIEEILFRGYALERLTFLTGSPTFASALSISASALAHVPAWGWGPCVTFAASAAILTLFYFCRRDLPANIIAHVATDTVGLVLYT